jgi:hypothetical protein
VYIYIHGREAPQQILGLPSSAETYTCKYKNKYMCVYVYIHGREAPQQLLGWSFSLLERVAGLYVYIHIYKYIDKYVYVCIQIHRQIAMCMHIYIYTWQGGSSDLSAHIQIHTYTQIYMAGRLLSTFLGCPAHYWSVAMCMWIRSLQAIC